MKMKRYILAAFFALTLSVTVGQTTAPGEYYVLVKKADDLYHIKDYKNAAITYSSAFKTFGWLGYANDRYSAACCWAMAGFPDSAFFNLYRIAEKAGYADYRSLIWEDDLMPLYHDDRWQQLLKIVSANRAKNDSAAGYNKPLVHLLDSLTEEDQKWRSYSRRYGNHRFPPAEDTISRKDIDRNGMIADSLNYFQVQAVFKKYGFPDYDLVGKERSNGFWGIVQHQDNHPAFQDSVLEKMKIEVDTKKASAADYAYLVDRVKINTHQLQVYGTQMEFNADTTSFEPKPVIAPEKLNDRRKSMGLGTIESYIEVMNNRFWGALKKR